ncbi:[protein-PII] uridylyltransferase family protein [Actinomyces haliotis]|uniref:[protein-PII] uridylyltransferase family protein n=1 Tax=Actinomyces haliotis TaxID=1280843 RepID=UPI00188EEE9D|nr:HD domain-containing protein [Actinomyces haliotis]
MSIPTRPLKATETKDEPSPVLAPEQAAVRHPHPSTWTSRSGREWRVALAAEVEAGLRGLWSSATTAMGLQDDPDAGPQGPGRRTPSPDGGRAGSPGADVPTPGLALACVGSLARREAGPASDLDLVLLTDGHADSTLLAGLAERLWYPVWDSGVQLDHSVRTVAECRTVASHDLAAALGLLDLRHVAGDAFLTEQAASALLTDWRSATRKRLPELAEEARDRAEAFGELAGLLEPDLKEARGGLRDAVLVRALAASSLADRPHGEFDRAVDDLLNVRDALALATGRSTNRLVQAVQDDVADVLGLDDPEEPGARDAAAGPGDAGGLRSAEGAARAADEGSAPLVVVAPEHASGLTDAEDLPCPGPEGDTQHLDARDRMLTGAYSASREIAAALDTTMRSALRAARPARRPLTLVRFGRRSAPVLERLDEDVVAHGGEVALADRAVPDADPALPLRVALASVRSGQPIATVTRASLRRCPSPRGTWSDEPAVREDRERTGAGTAPAGGSSSMLGRLVDLLGSGDELVRVWEDLDRASLPVRWFPGWSAVLNRPQHNPLHLYTVDRHMVRTAAVAGRLLGDDGGARVLDHLGLPGLDAGAGSRDRKALLVTALLHDLGKVPGVVGEAHAAAGAQRVPAVLDVLGIAGADAEEIVLLVREHLLLGLAATKAPGDSAVVDAANEALGDGTRARRRLSLLRLLTEADSRAAGPRAWTSVRAGVVDQATAALAAEL